MTNKITLDPALVRSVLGYANKEAIEVKIENEKYIRLVINRNALFDVVDIHRFKDLAIEWCAGKGWLIISQFDRVSVRYNHRNEDFWVDDEGGNRNYPSRLSAELAAISFVWEQIQKEKKDER